MCDLIICPQAKKNKLITPKIKKDLGNNIVQNTPRNKCEEKKLEDYYFGRPEKNEYSDEDLLNMEIQEIIFGIHPTAYGEDLSQKSFHPFFYLQLNNEDCQDFGVVIHYIHVPQDATKDQIHLYGENGIEFIEKNMTFLKKN